MLFLRTVPLLAAAGILLACSQCVAAAAQDATPPPRPRGVIQGKDIADPPAPDAPPRHVDVVPELLDGVEKSLVVVGYSTSYAWPQMLQEMLDWHSGGERVYHVLNAVVGGAPVEHWIAAEGSPNHERTVGAMVRDFFGPDARLRGAAPEPTVAICQQSLQFTKDRRGPVKATHDMVGAELGADAIEKMCLSLRDLGVEDVRIAMHIYKKPVEPEVGNERIALRRLLDRGHGFVHAGPDVWQPTKDAFPHCFDDDELHPNELGMKMMAALWYRSIAGDRAREDVVARMYTKDYDVRAMMRDYLRWRRE